MPFCTLRSIVTVFALVCGLWAAQPGTAYTHGLFIFAWAEAEQVCTESYYSKKIKAKEITVGMYTTQGELLAQRQSNEKGIACFPLPHPPQDILFVADAGQGHRGTFTLPRKKLSFEGESPMAATNAAPPQEQNSALNAAAGNRTTPPEPNTKEQYTRAREQSQSPGFKEIAIGLAWIIGITITLLLYKKKRRP